MDQKLILQPRLCPKAHALGQTPNRLQQRVHGFGVLPRQQYLCCRSGRHRELTTHGHRIAQAGRTFCCGHAYAELALAAEQLGRFAGDVSQTSQNWGGGGQEPVLAGGSSEFTEAGPEDESPLQVAANKAMMF